MVTIALYQHASHQHICLNQLQLTCKHICSVGLNQKVYLILLPQTCSYVPMLLPNHNVFSYIVRSVYSGIYLFIFWTVCFPKVGTMILSDLAIGGLQSGIWIDEYDYQNKDKNNITKSFSLLFFRAVYHSKNHVIPHPVIAAILDVILNISKRRK